MGQFQFLFLFFLVNFLFSAWLLRKCVKRKENVKCGKYGFHNCCVCFGIGFSWVDILVFSVVVLNYKLCYQ